MSDTDTEVEDFDLEAASPETTVPVSVVRKIRDDARKAQQARDLEIAELRGRVDTLASKPLEKPAQTPSTFTRAQLDAAVAEGRLSQEAADATWETQIVGRAEAAAERKIDARDTATRVESEIDRYVAANPDIKTPGTPARDRVTREFNALVRSGLPSNKATELAALKAAFGPVEGLRQQQGARETHQETGSAGGSGERRANADAAPKELSAGQRAHYQRMIDNGFYTGWKDPRLVKETQYVRPRASRAA